MEKKSTYTPDLSQISLGEFKCELKTGRLLPGRKSLLDGIDAKFALIEKEGIHDAGGLKETLDSNPKIKQIAQKTGIPEDYFRLLRREVHNLLPKPIKFSDVPGISDTMVAKLHALGIDDTEDLFPCVRDPNLRKKFYGKSGIPMEDILRLTKLVDVSRIKWVGPKLAKLIVDTPYDTVEKLAAADPSDIYRAFQDAKKLHGEYRGALGIRDIDSWIRQVVRRTPLVIEYEGSDA